MIEGVLRHCTEMDVERQLCGQHGQSEVAFAFCHLLGFELLPRLKASTSRSSTVRKPGSRKPTPIWHAILTRPINWELIRQQYDQMVKFATALRLGTAERKRSCGGSRATIFSTPPTRRWPSWVRPQDDFPLPLSAFSNLAPGDPRRPECGRELEQRQWIHLLRQGRRVEQPPEGHGSACWPCTCCRSAWSTSIR